MTASGQAERTFKFLDVVKMTRYSDLARWNISSKSEGPKGRGEEGGGVGMGRGEGQGNQSE
jgi:hypothetical protein